jgi:HD superfamily phosphohydrolase
MIVISFPFNPIINIEEWMFDIINNKRNSIDVDKFDYINRDTLMMGINYGKFDHENLLSGAKVMDN